MVKRELSQKAKLLNYQIIYVPILTYGHKLLVEMSEWDCEYKQQNWAPFKGWYDSP